MILSCVLLLQPGSTSLLVSSSTEVKQWSATVIRDSDLSVNWTVTFNSFSCHIKPVAQQTVKALLLLWLVIFHVLFILIPKCNEVVFACLLSTQREHASSVNVFPDDSGASLYNSIHTLFVLSLCNKTSDGMDFIPQGGDVCLGQFWCLMLLIWSFLWWSDLMCSRSTSRTRSDTSSPTSTL